MSMSSLVAIFNLRAGTGSTVCVFNLFLDSRSGTQDAVNPACAIHVSGPFISYVFGGFRFDPTLIGRYGFSPWTDRDDRVVSLARWMSSAVHAVATTKYSSL